MNVKLFKSAIDEISSSESFKNRIRETLQRALNNSKPQKNKSFFMYKKIIPIMGSLILCLGIVICTIVYLQNKGTKLQQPIDSNCSINILQINDNFYFGNNSDINLSVYNKKTKRITTLVKQYTWSMISSENLIYYATVDNQIYQFNTKTNSNSLITNICLPDKINPIKIFYSDKQYIYFSKDNYDFSTKIATSIVYRLSLDNHKYSVIYSTNKGSFYDVKVVGNYIYYSLISNSYGGIYKISLDGNFEKRLCDFQWIGHFFVYKDKFVFEAKNSTKKFYIYTMNLEGCNQYQISPSESFTCAISVNKNFAYFEAHGFVYKYNLDTNEIIRISTSEATDLYAVDDGVLCYYPPHLLFYNNNTNISANIF